LRGELDSDSPTLPMPSWIFEELMFTPSRIARWLQPLYRRFLVPSPHPRRRSRLSLCIETLEQRTLLSITPTLTGNNVTFAGSGDLYLKAVNGQLQWKEAGGTFSADLDLSASGVQALSLDSSSLVYCGIGGTVFVDSSTGFQGQLYGKGAV